jgi:hypothetical protein
MAVLLEGKRLAMVGQCQRGSTQLPGLPITPSLPVGYSYGDRDDARSEGNA